MGRRGGLNRTRESDVEAVIVAAGVLAWTAAAACLEVVRVLLPPAAGATRSAWLALVVAIVAGALIAALQLLLPGSVLSQGWSRETLQGAQQGGAAVVVLVAVAALWRGHRQLQPARAAAAAPARRAGGAASGPAGATAGGKTKRRP